MVEDLIDLIADGYELTYAAIIMTSEDTAHMVLRMKGEGSTEILPYRSDKIPLISKFIRRQYPSVPIMEKTRVISF